MLGYSADKDGNILSEVTNIKINMSETKSPTVTENITFRGNLDSRFEIGDSKKIDTVIYDSLGNSYTLTFNVEKTANHTWNLSLSRITDIFSGNYTEVTTGIVPGDTLELRFNDNGKLIGIGTEDLDTTTGFKTQLTGLSAINFDKNKDGEDLTTPTVPGGSFREITLFDLENEDTIKDVTQYANEMGIKPYGMDGNTSGTLEGFSIDATGTVVGVFTNGERKALGQIMLAKFDNPMGLQKLGNNFL